MAPNRFATHPFLFATLDLQAREPGVGSLQGDLRIKKRSGEASADVRVAKIVPRLGWNRYQPIYFQATSGRISWNDVGSDAAQLDGQIAGLYRPPVNDLGLLAPGDFDVGPAFSIMMSLSLTVAFSPAAAAIPRVTGTISLASEHLPSLAGGRRVEADVLTSFARVFPQDLPAIDLAGENYIYQLDVQPVLVQGPANSTTRHSADRLLAGAAIWRRDCGIEIVPGPFDSVTVAADVIEHANQAKLVPLIDILSGRRSAAVPVAFVPAAFSRGGGYTTEPGVERAIVLVVDPVPEANRTLLAHEIGHVLGGQDAGEMNVQGLWVGDPGTVMHATDSIDQGPPDRIGDDPACSDCEHARRFAAWKRLAP